MALLRNGDVYPLYTPLRNALRKLDLCDSLLVLWNYAQNYAFDRRVDCTQHILTAFGSGNRQQKACVFGEWEIETLTWEVIINAAAMTGPSRESLKDGGYLARCIDKLRQLENGILDLLSSTADPMDVFRRMLHKQFPWQSNALPGLLFVRYGKMYQHPQLNQIFEDHFGLTREQFYLAAMALIAGYMNTPCLDDPPPVIGPKLARILTPQVLQRFLGAFSLPLSELRQRLVGEQQLNEDYAYGFSSLRAYPILRMNWMGVPSLVCPIPALLIWAVTQGVYYQLVHCKDFDHALGAGFQAYVGEVLGRTTVHGREYRKVEEEEFVAGHDRLRTVDWILAEPTAALFVECKAKRLTMSAKTSLAAHDDTRTDLAKIAEAVVQVYKTIEQYRANRYPSFPYDPNRAIYPVVVTMEDWYIIDPKTKEYVEQKVEQGLDSFGIRRDVLARMPYTICSVQELEHLAQVLQAVSITEVMGGWAVHADQHLFHGTYLYDTFADRCSNTTCLFPDAFRGLFPHDIQGL